MKDPPMVDFDVWHKGKGNSVDLLVANALHRFVPGRDAAVDLGAGNLRHSRFLIESGFSRVVAVDLEFNSNDWIAGIDMLVASIVDYAPEKNTFDYAICSNVLYFLTLREMYLVIGYCHAALKTGGVLVCNFFGERDGWAAEWDAITPVTKSDLDSLQRGWESPLGEPIEFTVEGKVSGKLRHMYELVLIKNSS
jgi:SAM-dependent methyltransferase